MVIQPLETLSNIALQNTTNTITDWKNRLSFSEVFSAVRGTTQKETNALSAAFPTNDVSIKVGNCTVDDQIWQRKDFPAWRYFQEDTEADCLNHWKPRGKAATGKEPYIQSELKKIGRGKMVEIVPESLREKMDADPEFARKIAEKVQDWKVNYDKMDNALAASYGEDPVLFQLTKSYCIQMDEKGDVKRYMVVGGGMDTKKASQRDRTDIQALQNSLVRAITRMTLQSGAANMVYDYGQPDDTNFGLMDDTTVGLYYAFPKMLLRHG